MNTGEFSVGDMAEWTSQANGSRRTKTGRVVAIVPAAKYPYQLLASDKRLEQYDWAAIDMRSGNRLTTSYLIAVATKTTGGRMRAIEKLYWPRVALLKKVASHGVD